MYEDANYGTKKMLALLKKNETQPFLHILIGNIALKPKDIAKPSRADEIMYAEKCTVISYNIFSSFFHLIVVMMKKDF